MLQLRRHTLDDVMLGCLYKVIDKTDKIKILTSYILGLEKLNSTGKIKAIYIYNVADFFSGARKQ